MNLDAGEKVGRYTIVSFIGAGGMTRIRDLRLSPDGATLAFRLREARLGKAFALYVLDSAGKNPRKLGEWQNAKGLAWAPDGERVVFASGGDSGSTELHAVTLRGASELLGRFDG